MDHKKELSIFLVDDDVFCLEIHRHFLASIGYRHVKTFDRGQGCIDSLGDHPDVIFLDYQMEAMNGLEVLKKIKRFDPGIHVVLYSGQQDMQVTINTLKYGAFDYVIKNDYELERIKDVLERIQQLSVLLEPLKQLKRHQYYASFLS